MKMIYLSMLFMIIGCTPQPQFDGPASLLLVPPSYYSTRPPPISHNKRIPMQAEVTKPKYYYPEPGKPVIVEEQPPSQIENKLDEAADKLYKIKQRLNRRRPPFGSSPVPPMENPEATE